MKDEERKLEFRAEFLEMYASYFPGLTARDGLRHWFRFIDLCDEEQLLLAIRKISYFWTKAQIKGKPRLGEVERVYGEVCYERKQNLRVNAPVLKCGLCRQTGQCFGVYDFVDDCLYRFQSKNTRRHKVIMLPCKCAFGFKVREKIMGREDTIEKAVLNAKKWAAGSHNLYSTIEEAKAILL